MAELNMIDTMGYGIHEMFLGQAKRFFPLPDFDLSDPQAVKITILGRIVDPAYTRALIKKTDLGLQDILALDRVQKHLPLDDETIRHLKRLKLIEGRKPHLHVSASIADISNTKAAYIKTRTLDDRHYRKLVVEYLEKFREASREDVDGFLLAKLGDALDAKQKQTKIGNLLTGMRKAGVIHNTGSRAKPCWQLAEKE